MSSTCHAGSDGAKGNIGTNVQAGDAKGTEDHVLIDCKLLMLEVIIHDSDGLLLSFFKDGRCDAGSHNRDQDRVDKDVGAVAGNDIRDDGCCQ